MHRLSRTFVALLALLTLTACTSLDVQPLATLVAPLQTAIAPAAATFAPIQTAVAPAATRPPVPATPTAVLANAIPPDATVARLVKVIDGDTIDVAIAGQTERVRYVGVDTPERGQPGYQAATEANRALLGSGPLYLVRDVSDRDKTSSHRLLRYVYRGDGRLVEAELVRAGWAQPVEYPPDTRHAAEYRRLAVEAAKAGRGFWSATPPPDGAMPYALTLKPAEVRKGPGAAFGVTETLPPATPLTVYGRTAQGDWLQVRTPTRKGGWVAAAAVRLNVQVAAVGVSAQ